MAPAGDHVERIRAQFTRQAEVYAGGGPDADRAGRIRELLRASLDRDLCGLDVRVEEGRLRFSHRTAACLLRVSRGG